MFFKECKLQILLHFIKILHLSLMKFCDSSLTFFLKRIDTNVYAKNNAWILFICKSIEKKGM